MYFFDPELGEIRRSMLMDKLQGKRPKTVDALAHKAEVVQAKVEDVTAKADETVADAVENVGHKTDDALDKTDEIVAEKVDGL